MEPTPDRQRLEWLSRAVHALNANPDVQDRLTDAFRRDDPKTFAKVVTEHWRKYGIEPPADKCDPYVTGYIFALREPELVQTCTWVGGGLSSISTGTSGATLTFTGTSQALLKWLIAQGLVQCTWGLKNQEAELQVIKKFVQGICPPGTF